MRQLTALNGKKEWEYEGKTLIAIADEGICKNCVFAENCTQLHIAISVNCTDDFTMSPFVVFIEKPAEQ